MPLTGSEGLGLDELAFLCTATVPLVIFGGLGNAVSNLCSRSQLPATRVDASACSAVSKQPIEVTTPLPESMRE